MKIFKACVSCLILGTFPLSSVPLKKPMHIEHNIEHPGWSYDTLIQCIETLEHEDFSSYSPAQIQQINQFLVELARQGSLPEQEAKLESDIELLEATDNIFSFAPLNLGQTDFLIASTDSPFSFFHCKSWTAKKWHQTKKFVKNHKKEIIIGAIVVTAVVVIATTVPALIAGAAAGAAAAVESDSKAVPEEHSTAQGENTVCLESAAQEIVQEETVYFKETIAQETFNDSDHTFQEKARELGSHYVHRTLDAVSDLCSMIPKSVEELQISIQSLTPEQLYISESDLSDLVHRTPTENYENTVAFLHQSIDTLFNTDQAQYHTPECRADQAEKFVTGTIPPPLSSTVTAKSPSPIETFKESLVIMGDAARTTEIVQLEKSISDWLGDSTQLIRNKAGDPIFLSKDGLRKVRFDFRRTHPHESPHLHFEQLVDGEWKEISRVYPIDVPHK